VCVQRSPSRVDARDKRTKNFRLSLQSRNRKAPSWRPAPARKSEADDAVVDVPTGNDVPSNSDFEALADDIGDVIGMEMGERRRDVADLKHAVRELELKIAECGGALSVLSDRQELARTQHLRSRTPSTSNSTLWQSTAPRSLRARTIRVHVLATAGSFWRRPAAVVRAALSVRRASAARAPRRWRASRRFTSIERPIGCRYPRPMDRFTHCHCEDYSSNFLATCGEVCKVGFQLQEKINRAIAACAVR
jgi:hypothetical protein